MRKHCFLHSSVTLLLIAWMFPVHASGAEKYSEVRIPISGRGDVQLLQQRGLELDHIKMHGTYFDTVLDEEGMAFLQEERIGYEVLVDDLVADYLSRSTMSPQGWQELQTRMKQEYPLDGFEYGSMGGYYTNTQVLRELDSMRMVYPNLITVRQSIGLSLEGRDIWMVKISDNPEVDEQEPDILYTALHHAREPQGMMGLMYYMYYLLENYGTDPEVTELVNTREMFFIPVMNVDGYVYNEQTDPNGGGMWRKNRRNNGNGSYGVDLNRNYGYYWGYDNFGSSPDPFSETYRGTAAFSEPETQVIRDFCNTKRIQLALNYHTYGNLLIYPWAYLDSHTPDSAIFTDLAVDMTQFNHYTYGTPGETVGYSVNGSSDDWMYGEQSTKPKIFAMTPEVGDWFWPSPSDIYPLAEEVLYFNLQVAHGAGVIVVDAYDPNPPTNLVAYSDFATPTSASLTWTDPSTYAGGDTLTDFIIEIHRDGAVVGTVQSGIQTFSDQGLTDGQSYHYELFARDMVDSLSWPTEVTVIAGGAKEPNPPTSLVILQNGADLLFRWTNPSRNIDGTPMDDFAGINLYEDALLVASFVRSGADSARTDSVLYTPSPGSHQYYITAFDNELPANESDPSNPAYAPLSLPFTDQFPIPGVPASGYWFNDNGEVTDLGVNPPSSPYVLTLDGFPWGGDTVSLFPVDLSGFPGGQVLLTYSYQPQGSGNAPEGGDRLFVEFLNDLGEWREAESYAGSGMYAFRTQTIDVASVDPGAGATFYHPAFQFRFRNIGTASTDLHYDHWHVDNVQLEGITTWVEEDGLPLTFALLQNYPNPFNPSTVIRYELPVTAGVSLIVYDLLGREVTTIVHEEQAAGRYQVAWDARNSAGQKVGSGVYMFRLKAGAFDRTLKMMFVK